MPAAGLTFPVAECAVQEHATPGSRKDKPLFDIGEAIAGLRC